MDNNPREDIMVLDLNQEPLDQSNDSLHGLESILNDMEATHGHIEERIRQLEAVTSRARQRRRLNESQPPAANANMNAGNIPAPVHNEGRQHNADDATAGGDRTIKSGKTNKRDGAHLIALALGLDADTKKSGSFFDCNICLAMAKDPVLTCCGHLFCWPCFYHLSYVHSNAKECPVCEGEVMDTSIIPIYGSGNSKYSCKSKQSALKIPRRPNAHRIESIRQQLISQEPSPSLIEERIQQLSNMVGGMSERSRAPDSSSMHALAERARSMPSRRSTFQTSTLIGETSNLHHDALHVTRLFSSLSSVLNSAMDSAERLVENLEAIGNSHHMRRSHQLSPHVLSRDAAAVIQPESLTSDTAAEMNFSLLPSASSSRINISPSVGSENQTMDTETNSIVPSSSSRRRNGIPRVSDASSGVSHEGRRS